MHRGPLVVHHHQIWGNCHPLLGLFTFYLAPSPICYLQPSTFTNSSCCPVLYHFHHAHERGQLASPSEWPQHAAPPGRPCDGGSAFLPQPGKPHALHAASGGSNADWLHSPAFAVSAVITTSLSSDPASCASTAITESSPSGHASGAATAAGLPHRINSAKSWSKSTNSNGSARGKRDFTLRT